MISAVLILNDQWFVGGEEFAPPSTEPADAVGALFAFWAERDLKPPRRLQLLYQPPWLSGATMSCPNAGRAVLRRVLQAEQPALADPERAWSYLPMVPVEDGFSTVLHIETSPWLFRFRHEMRQRGCRIEAAWPLRAVLEHLAPDSFVALAQGGRISLHRPGHEHRATWEEYAGSDAVLEVMRALAEQPAGPGVGSARLVWISDAAPGTEFPDAVGNVQHLGLGELARAMQELPLTHLANLLPPEPKLSPANAVLAAGILSWGAVAALGWQQLGEFQQRREREAAHATAVSQLQAEIAAFEANRREIESIRALTGGVGPHRAHAELLRQLAIVTPPEIVLTSFQATGDTLSLNGFVSGDPQTAQQATAGFARGLASVNAPWRFEAPTIGADGAFTLTGRLLSQ